jgi:putative redox protein
MRVVNISSVPGGYQQKIKAGSHDLIADVPESMGGKGTGPDPHELLLAALGSCTTITLQMYAKRKEWDLKDVKVTLTEDAIEDPNTAGKKLSVITRKIQVQGDLNKEQVDTLLQIADKCPVHKLLVGEKKIDSTIALAAAV